MYPRFSRHLFNFWIRCGYRIPHANTATGACRQPACRTTSGKWPPRPCSSESGCMASCQEAMPAGRASPAGPAWPRDSQPCSQPGLASTQPGLACGRLASKLTACWAGWRACGFERSDFLKLTIQFPIQFSDPFFSRHLRSETTKKN